LVLYVRRPLDVRGAIHYYRWMSAGCPLDVRWMSAGCPLDVRIIHGRESLDGVAIVRRMGEDFCLLDVPVCRWNEPFAAFPGRVYLATGDELPRVVPPIMDDQSAILGTLQEAGAIAETAVDKRREEGIGIPIPLGGARDITSIEASEISIGGIVHGPAPETEEVTKDLDFRDAHEGHRFVRFGVMNERLMGF